MVHFSNTLSLPKKYQRDTRNWSIRTSNGLYSNKVPTLRYSVCRVSVVDLLTAALSTILNKLLLLLLHLRIFDPLTTNFCFSSITHFTRNSTYLPVRSDGQQQNDALLARTSSYLTHMIITGSAAEQASLVREKEKQCKLLKQRLVRGC